MAKPPRQKKGSQSSWQKRNAKAVGLGYRNYYDYRVHQYGKQPASEPADIRQRARLRGHRSRSDLLRSVRDEDFVVVDTKGPRNKLGQYKWADFTVKRNDGSEDTFRLQGSDLKHGRLEDMVSEIMSLGGLISPAPSLDIRKVT